MPKKLPTILTFLLFTFLSAIAQEEIKIDRFEKQIEAFRRFDNRNTPVKNPILFVGSSSIVHWETFLAFPEYPVMNRGFGGASIPEIIYYYEDVIKKHEPSILVIYSDIDIERGKSPEVTLNAYKELLNMVSRDFPQSPVVLISMKPAFKDKSLGKNVRRNKEITNKMLLEYCTGNSKFHFVDITAAMMNEEGDLNPDIFLPDGMHLNAKGYRLWNPIIRKKLQELKH